MPQRKRRKAAGSRDKLETYRRKRSPAATPEPFGGAAPELPGLFVVQKHAARRTHYDFRLAIDGVLASWAVPRGPSLDPADKRLAVATEDHPLEYGDFEGVIPEGNYGAGAVIVWDRGRAVHEIDPADGLADGKLLFRLEGYKLRGLWTLVRTARDPKEWLLIKKADEAATGETVAELDDTSVFSGLAVEELADGRRRAAEIAAEVESAGARRRRLEGSKVKVMLTQLTGEPFSRAGWLFELKYDGYRAIAESSHRGVGAQARAGLFYRSGRDATASYPDLARALTGLPWELVLDGEIVVLDEAGRPSFQRLQKRALLTRPADVERAAVGLPATYYAFDLLGFEGLDLRRLPLVERKRFLARVLPRSGALRYADHVEERGQEMYEEIRRLGLEGMIGKDAASAYRGGRSAKWLKVRAELIGDFVVVGYTRPQGTRTGFGALHLGVWTGSGLAYVGRVGSGFSDRQLGELSARLERRRRAAPALAGEVPGGREHVWVEPELVVEVKYTEWTEGGQLRHPVFVQLREDKRIEECRREEEPPAPPPSAAAAARQDAGLAVTRPEKVFWPAEGYTKGDLDAYYQAVAPWLLPFLRQRPIVLDRYPDGIDAKSFFQKKAPDFVPDWVVTEAIWSDEDEGGEESRYFMVGDEAGLRYLVNLGAIPLHIWHSRLPALTEPDWCVLDLDAKDAPFAFVVTAARAIKELCDEIALPCYAKTSGATGLHVLVPLAGQLTYEQSKSLGEVLCRTVADRLPDKTSVDRLPRHRSGRVYLDYLQNGYGKLIVAPYSVRPLAGAPVSMPLAWREVNGRLEPSRFTLASAPRRLERLKRDPWKGVLERRVDLAAALERLAERL